MKRHLSLDISVSEDWKTIGSFRVDIPMTDADPLVDNVSKIEAVRGLIPLALSTAFDQVRKHLLEIKEKDGKVVDAEVLL